MYDYRSEVRNDIKNYIEENIDCYEFDSIEEVEEKLYDDMFCDDCVTGNGSGSYTFSRKEAEENLVGNLDLLAEAFGDFGYNGKILESGAEACDVTIRCYLLGEYLHDVLMEVEDEFKNNN